MILHESKHCHCNMPWPQSFGSTCLHLYELQCVHLIFLMPYSHRAILHHWSSYHRHLPYALLTRISFRASINTWPLHWCIVALCPRHTFVILRSTTWCISTKSMPSICWRTSYITTFVTLPSTLNWYLDVPLLLRLSFTVRFIRLPFDHCSSKLVSSPLLSHIIRKYPHRIFVLWTKLVIAICPCHYVSHRSLDGSSNPTQPPPE